MPDIVATYTIAVEQSADFEFRVRFDKPEYGEVHLDEPPPLGKDRGPNAGRILAAAVGNCLSASLLFASRKNGATIGDIRAEVTVEVEHQGQNHRGRGVSTDSIEASAHAFLNAINKIAAAV